MRKNLPVRQTPLVLLQMSNKTLTLKTKNMFYIIIPTA